VRPEKMALQLEAPSAEQRAHAVEHGFNCVQGVISSLAYFGNETHYQVKLASGMELKVTRTNAARRDDAGLGRDQQVYVWWDGSDAVVLTN